MSTTTMAPAFTSRIIMSCTDHPNDTCVELKLPNEAKGDHLHFLFVTVRNPGDYGYIGVVQDLLLQCQPYRAPSGYKIVDNKTVHFFYPNDADDHPIAFEAQNKLQNRLQRHLEEVTATYRRDPQTHFVSKR